MDFPYQNHFLDVSYAQKIWPHLKMAVEKVISDTGDDSLSFQDGYTFTYIAVCRGFGLHLYKDLLNLVQDRLKFRTDHLLTFESNDAIFMESVLKMVKGLRHITALCKCLDTAIVEKVLKTSLKCEFNKAFSELVAGPVMKRLAKAVAKASLRLLCVSSELVKSLIMTFNDLGLKEALEREVSMAIMRSGATMGHRRRICNRNVIM